MSLQSKCNIDKFCTTMIETYNTSFLDRVDEEFRQACFDEAQRCTKTEFGTIKREVLMRLLRNYSVQNNPDVSSEFKKPKVDFIGGPYTLTLQWSEEYKKLIYIFGEYHDKETNCPSGGIKIEDYLLQLIQNSDVFIDFYLEVHGYKDFDYINKPWETYRLHEIFKNFENCIPKSTLGLYKECHLSRIHYFDIRQSEGIKLNSVSVFDNTFGQIEDDIKIMDIEKNKVLLRDFFSNHDVISVITEISDIISIDKYFEFLDRQIDEFEFLTKKVDKSAKKDKIKEFIKKEIRLHNFTVFNPYAIVKYAYRIRTFISRFYDPTDFTYNFVMMHPEDHKQLIQDILWLSNFLAYFNALIPDGYLLARIFKNFDINNQNPKKKRYTDEPEEPHNIIIYAGDAHSDRIRKFLCEELKFKLIDQAGTKWPKDSTKTDLFSNCIDMRNFPQPFFSNLPEVDWLIYNSKIET